MVGFVDLDMRHLDMRVTISCSRSRLPRQELSILIEEMFLPLIPLLGTHLLLFIFDLFIGLIQIVSARGRSSPHFLLIYYPINIGEFTQSLIQLVQLAFLSILGLIPRILRRMRRRCRQYFDSLDMIVHILSLIHI